MQSDLRFIRRSAEFQEPTEISHLKNGLRGRAAGRFKFERNWLSVRGRGEAIGETHWRCTSIRSIAH